MNGNSDLFEAFPKRAALLSKEHGMTHEILKTIPHERVIMKQGSIEEIFDLYLCGVFKNNSLEENIELVELPAQSSYRPHYHKKSAAVIYVITGTGHLQLDDRCIEYNSGTRVAIPAGVLHGFKTITSTLFLSIQSPSIIDPVSGQIDLYYE